MTNDKPRIVVTDTDLRRFERRYPYLAFGRVEQTVETDFAQIGDHYIRMTERHREGSSHTFHADEHGRFGHFGTTNYLTAKNAQAAIAVKLMERFRSLWVSAHLDQHGISIALWVRRHDGREGTSVGGLRFATDDGVEEKLALLDSEAEASLRDGLFFCTGHQRAEKKERYGYSHFVGVYCAEWGDEHPRERAYAASENYR